MPDQLPKYRHYKPKNLGVVRINGRDIYLGRFNSPESWERYARVIAEWRATGAAAPPRGGPQAGRTPEEGPSVAEVILGFVGFAETYYRHADGTPTEELAAYERTLRPLRKLYDGTPA